MDQENMGQVSAPAKSKAYYIIGTIIILVIIGWAVSGLIAKKSSENILENEIGGNVDVNLDKGNVSAENEDGKISVGRTVEWPADIPVPEFTAGKLTMATSAYQNGGGWQVIASNVSKEDFDAYSSLLKSNGWNITSHTDTGVIWTQMEKAKYGLIISLNSSEKVFTLLVTAK